MAFSISDCSSVEEVKRTRLFTTSILDYANEKRQTGLFNDIEICIGSDSIPANKLILACFSPYFEKMFTTEMKEKYQKSVEIQCGEPSTLKSLFEYIYTGTIRINSDNVCDLLSTANYLQIEDVKQYSYDFLESAVTPENCLKIIKIAQFYEYVELEKNIKELISNKFEEVAGSDEFMNLPKNEMKAYICNLDRNQVQETSVYNALLKWIKHDKVNRECDWLDVFQTVNLQLLPSTFLKEVAKEDLVINNLACSKLLIQALTEQKITDQIEASGSKILSLGGVHSTSKVVEVFSCLNKPPLKYPDLPQNRSYGCSITFNNFVYFVGGENASVPCDTVWRMNVKANNLEWEKWVHLRKKRRQTGLAVFNGTVVVVGGYGVSFARLQGEYFSNMLKQWKEIPSTRQLRIGHALVTCNDRLYAIGGYGETISLTTVEMYEAGNVNWENVIEMQTPRVRMAAVEYDGFIYVMGGNSKSGYSTRLKSAERFDVANNEWNYISDMAFARESCAACVLQGKIYVIGGANEENKAVMEIECYDPITEEWSVVGKTEDVLFGHSLVVV